MLRFSLLALVLLAVSPLRADEIDPARLPIQHAGDGVSLRELIGLSASAPARSGRCSIALFRVEPGHATAWSYNRKGEETFLVTSGRGTVWLGNRAVPVAAGAVVAVPPGIVHSVRAATDAPVEFYAVSAPAFSPDDFALGSAPDGAPR
jgi:mannose-6-phosphate isomerase-like protein (cupin superfamily)